MKKNIPNILSVLRIFLVPIFVYIFFLDYPKNVYFALAIFLLAGLTDIVDGYLARRNNWITDLGKLLDPLADKLMQSAVMICLAIKNIVPLWLVVIFILKELFMMVGALLVLKKIKVTVKSHWYGKATTSIIYAAVVIVLLLQDKNIGINPDIVFIIPLIFTLLSLIMYIADTIKINSQIKKDGKNSENQSNQKENI